MLGSFISTTLNSLSPSHRRYSVEFEGLISQLNNVPQDEIIFYPSANKDYSDVLFANGLMVDGLDFNLPQVYIHADGFNYIDIERFSDYQTFLFSKPTFRTLLNEKIEINQHQCLRIRNIERIGLKSDFWLLEFSGFINEDVIKQMINTKIRIKLLYNKCDGVFSGMGDFWNSIPPQFFWFLFPELNIKFCLSEYPLELLEKEIKLLFETGKWMNNITTHFPDLNFERNKIEERLKLLNYTESSSAFNSKKTPLNLGLFNYK